MITTEEYPTLIIAATSLVTTLWMFMSMLVPINGTEMLPATQVFAFGGPSGSWYNSALFTEWLLYSTFSFIEFIFWMIMGAVGPLYFTYWAYLTLWASIVLYLLPVIFNIVHGTQEPESWVEHGALAHLVVDLVVWVGNGVVHVLFFKKMVLYEGKKFQGSLWELLFWPEIEDVVKCECDPCYIHKHLKKEQKEVDFATCYKNCEIKCPALFKLKTKGDKVT